MLILLPPSEGKALPARGKPLDLDTLSFPLLDDARRVVLDALVGLCAGDPAVAAKTLGLGRTQLELVELNRLLHEAPTARADRIYTGVLYDALDLPGLTTVAKRRAASRVATTSALFGLLRPGDRVPAYRLSGDASLPGIGSVAGVWRAHLGDSLRAATGRGLLVDLRSSTYAAFWRPTTNDRPQVATVRVLHETGGRRSVVSHFNKATKGRIVAALLEDGRDPRSPAAFAEVLREHGWTVEVADPDTGGTRLDVVVSEL